MEHGVSKRGTDSGRIAIEAAEKRNRLAEVKATRTSVGYRMDRGWYIQTEVASGEPWLASGEPQCEK